MPRNPYMGGYTVGDLISVSQERKPSLVTRRPAVVPRPAQPDAIRTTVDFRPTPMKRNPRAPGRGGMG